MKKTGKIHTIIAVLVGVNILISLWAIFLPKANVDVKDALMEIESWRVWGAENLELLNQYYASNNYKSQQTAALRGALEQADAPAAAQQPTAQPTTDTAKEYKTIDTDKAAAIMKDAYIIGDKNARYTILEYSELLCPYCKRQHSQGTVNKVVAKYPKDVNTSFRHFIVHAPASKLAEGMECIAEQKGEDAYYTTLDKVFEAGSVTTEVLSSIAKELWVDQSKYDKCLADGKYTDKIASQTTEGRSLFGVSGTPGNVILDNETGRFVLIAGAYPVEKFIEELEGLLK